MGRGAVRQRLRRVSIRAGPRVKTELRSMADPRSDDDSIDGKRFAQLPVVACEPHEPTPRPDSCSSPPGITDETLVPSHTPPRASTANIGRVHSRVAVDDPPYPPRLPKPVPVGPEHMAPTIARGEHAAPLYTPDGMLYVPGYDPQTYQHEMLSLWAAPAGPVHPQDPPPRGLTRL